MHSAYLPTVSSSSCGPASREAITAYRPGSSGPQHSAPVLGPAGYCDGPLTREIVLHSMADHKDQPFRQSLPALLEVSHLL